MGRGSGCFCRGCIDGCWGSGRLYSYLVLVSALVNVFGQLGLYLTKTNSSKDILWFFFGGKWKKNNNWPVIACHGLHVLCTYYVDVVTFQLGKKNIMIGFPAGTKAKVVGRLHWIWKWIPWEKRKSVHRNPLVWHHGQSSLSAVIWL